MEFDPSARDGPPPRHAVESDSEDSDDEANQVRGIKRQQARTFQPPTVEMRSSAATAPQAGKPLIVFVGSSGEAYFNSQDVARFSEHAGLWVEGDQQAALHTRQDCTLALVHLGSTLVSQQATFAYISATLIASVKPSSIVIVDEYIPSLYLSDADNDTENRARSDEPVRWLSASKAALAIASNTADLAPFQAPNYLTGMGAALLSEASISALPATLLVLPRASASDANPYLQNAQLATAAAEAAHTLESRLARQLTSLLDPITGYLRATEQSAPGQPSLPAFLHDRRATERKRAQHDISAMYM